MKMLRLRPIIAVLALFLTIPLSAQFYSLGDEKGSLKWFQKETAHYRIIYPQGTDSLSNIYAYQLERYWKPVGNSAGYHPGELYRRKTPVILHTHHGISNGSVTLAPLRMDLFTLPQAYNPGPMAWEQSLAVHESRHVCQMQFGRDKALKPFNWFFGEMFSGAMSAVYPNIHLLEGDAVVAETSLTASGRGRESHFLNYYMSSFDEGDWKNWYQWRYGSYRYYTPDHYALGYLTVAGTRYCYDDPLFMDRYFDSVTRRPYQFGHLQRTIKKVSGKSFQESFQEISHAFHDQWLKDQEERKPFTESELLLEAPKWFTAYSEVCIGAGEIYAIKTGKLQSCELVRIDRYGHEKVLRQFSHHAGGLYLSEKRLWWSESIPDPRWSLSMQSVIRYMDLETEEVHYLTKTGRYFNPCPSPERDLVAVAEYKTNGENNILLLSSNDGDVRYRFKCPDGLQPSEFTWEDQILFFNAITENGTGLYQIKDFKISEVLAPLPIRISDLASEKSRMYFSSDRNGVNEFYELDYHSGNIYQLISLEYGGNDFCFNHQMKNLYYTVLQKNGNLLYRTSAEKLQRKLVDFSDVKPYAIADQLSRQEQELAGEKEPVQLNTMEISAPKPYRKGLHLFNFHSWAPLYVNQDRIMSLGGDLFSVSTASLGATAFFQSVLGDAQGSIAYQYARTGLENQYRSSVHAQFTYSGCYPVFDFKVDFGERDAIQYYRVREQGYQQMKEQIQGKAMSHPSFRATIRTYIPFNLSSSGWSRGVVPSLSYSLTNDSFDKSIHLIDEQAGLQPHQPGKNVFMQSLSVALRAYDMQYKAPARMFPKFGFSGEIGWQGRLGLTDLYTSSLYGYAYGYLPGFWCNHGIKWSFLGQHQFRKDCLYGENSVNTLPRGLQQNATSNFIGALSSDQFKMTADYSFPIYIGDIDWLCPVIYIQNLELRPYFDYTYVKMPNSIHAHDLYSAGGEFSLHCANLLWIPYHTTIGISACYNGGNLMSVLNNNGRSASDHYIGLVFRIDL